MRKDYATALVELRSKLDISQHELAVLLNASYPSVNRWENNKATPIKIIRVRIEKLCRENDIEISEVDE